MKELTNFNLKSMAKNGWTYRDGFLEKHFDEKLDNAKTITVEENIDTHNFNVYITHYSESSSDDETNKFNKRLNLARQKINYIGCVDDKKTANIQVDMYNLPAIICKETFQEKLYHLEKNTKYL